MCTKKEASAACRCGGESPRKGGYRGGVCPDRGFGVDLVNRAGFSGCCRYPSASKCKRAQRGAEAIKWCQGWMLLRDGWRVAGQADRQIILFRLVEQGVGVEPDHLLAEPFIDVFQRLHGWGQLVDGINPRRFFNVAE